MYPKVKLASFESAAIPKLTIPVSLPVAKIMYSSNMAHAVCEI